MARYCKPRPWGLAEWGSIASIAGIVFYLYDTWNTLPAPEAAEPLS